MRPFVPAIGGALLAVACATAQAAAVQADGGAAHVMIAATEEKAKDKPIVDRTDQGLLVNSIQQLFETVGACFVWPPKAQAHEGMNITVQFSLSRHGELLAPPRITHVSRDVPEDVRDLYREAVEAAFKRCTPIHFSGGMAAAAAGRPFIIRFHDDRPTGDESNKGARPNN